MLCKNGTQTRLGGGYIYVCRVGEDDNLGMIMINRCEYVRWCLQKNKYEMLYPKCQECINYEESPQ